MPQKIYVHKNTLRDQFDGVGVVRLAEELDCGGVIQDRSDVVPMVVTLLQMLVGESVLETFQIGRIYCTVRSIENKTMKI